MRVNVDYVQLKSKLISNIYASFRENVSYKHHKRIKRLKNEKEKNPKSLRSLDFG